MHRALGSTLQARHLSSEVASKLEVLSQKLNKNNLKAGSALEKLADGKHLREDSDCAAAVLVPLCTVDNKLSLLYTVRSKNMSHHRGEVSFPGGNRDKSDADLVATALRETYEEIGIPVEQVQVLGQLNPVPSRRNAYVMPVCGFIGELNMDKLNVNAREVDLVFTIPVEELISPTVYGQTQFRTYGGFILPVYRENPTVWGLTAIMTHMLLTAIHKRKEYGLDLKILRYK